MRHPRTIIAASGAAAVLGAVVAIGATGSTATPVKKAATPTMGTAIHTANAVVGGKSEAILVNSQGLPLYIYKPDTEKKSFVSGGLASIWPPLLSRSPTITGGTGKLSVTHDANGAQVAYNGHFPYNFVSDGPGHVTGQGVQNFFVATPGLGSISAGGASTSPAPTRGGLGY